MVTIHFESRMYTKSESKHFMFSHSAKTWLLLSGFLPSETEENTWENLYTGETAITTMGR